MRNDDSVGAPLWHWLAAKTNPKSFFKKIKNRFIHPYLDLRLRGFKKRKISNCGGGWGRGCVIMCVTSEPAKCKSHVADQSRAGSRSDCGRNKQCDSNLGEHGDRREHGDIRNLVE